jgi:hypothetical protein
MFIKNTGKTKTSIYINEENKDDKREELKKNEIEWDADYNGKVANVDLNIDNNGIKKHLQMRLNNQDLAELFNVPSIGGDLHKRIKNDFISTNRKSIKKKSSKILKSRNKQEKSPKTKRIRFR